MCLVLPSRVVSVKGDEAEVEMPGGIRAMVSTSLAPSLGSGQYVLVDRGLVLKVIEADEAEAILRIYREMEDFLPGADLDEAPAWAREAPA